MNPIGQKIMKAPVTKASPTTYPIGATMYRKAGSSYASRTLTD